MSNSAGSPNVPKNGQRGFQPADRCVNGTLNPPANRQGLGICEGCLERAREVENVAERRRSGEGSREVRNWRSQSGWVHISLAQVCLFRAFTLSGLFARCRRLP